ncbi:hypothetical protein [Rheinheimera hassiensis]|uniref:hypothetical protein n=1 Tax=Rheinheimera hassiensis TaxID=1193627 RepID=UPI001F053756|nr:hypothetical protein [Rheinheimera hassiensis]
MKTKNVTFQWSSKDFKKLNILLQKAGDKKYSKRVTKNPETFTLNEGQEYVYMVRARGKEGNSYELNITGATKAFSPVKLKILPGEKTSTFLDKFLV